MKGARLLLALGVLMAGNAQVVSARDKHRERAPDAVRAAVESGEIKPLATILEAVREKLPGDVTAIEIEQKKGRWMYELRVVGRDGRLLEIYVDAKTAEIERVKEK